MIDITLSKPKYRYQNRKLLRRDGIDPPGGTWVKSIKSNKSPGNNAGKAQKHKQGTGHRRRAGLGAITQ